MASVTKNFFMFTLQCKFGFFVVIKIGLVPVVGIMAAMALVAVTSVVAVIKCMA